MTHTAFAVVPVTPSDEPPAAGDINARAESVEFELELTQTHKSQKPVLPVNGADAATSPVLAYIAALDAAVASDGACRDPLLACVPPDDVAAGFIET